MVDLKTKTNMAELELKNVKSRLLVLNSLLKQYNWLTNSYILEFFTCDNFEKIPQSWKQILTRAEIGDIGHFLHLDQESELEAERLLWPLSLLCIRKVLQTFSLPRIQYSCISHSINLKKTTKEIKVTACMTHPRLKNLFVKHVKPKKRHEIGLMAEETARLAAKSNTDWIIDVGSGVGHLVRVLAYGYALKVCGVEIQQQLCEKARKLDAEIEVTASKHLSCDEIKDLHKYRPMHVAALIGPNGPPFVINQILKNCSDSEDCPNFGIVGLHPCGDLAVTLLHIFIACPQAKFINIVGCCYHKMTIRLMMGDYDHLKVHCYRAALERIITRHWPDHTRWGLNNVSHYPDLTFPDYCKKALQRFPLPIPEEDFDCAATQEDLNSWKKVVYFYSLWLLMGPAIESVILLDRLIYLHENGVEGQLKALFDPSLSPRNQVLSAIKET